MVRHNQGLRVGLEGTRRRLVHSDEWDANPFTFTIKGIAYDFFPISSLAKALNRAPNSIRNMEGLGQIPKTPFRYPNTVEGKRRRIYTRDMILGMVKIAEEEGVLFPSRGNPIPKRFTDRTHLLFTEILQKMSHPESKEKT